jgi:hypothetical protein
MIALLLFPLVEKIKHDVEHFSDEHCSKKDIHFCRAEHTCSICDYVFSSSSTPPDNEERILIFSKVGEEFKTTLVFNTLISPKYNHSLRGPPLLA